MGGAGPGIKHPAKTHYLITALCALLVFILSLIAIFVPWSWKNIAPFKRWEVGLWKNCEKTVNSNLGRYDCQDNDVDQVGSVSGGSKKCRGYIVATQVFTVAACVLALLTLILAALTMTKLWSKPVPLAAYTALLALLTFGCVLTAFLMWIVYAQQNCQPGNSRFPLGGYSWGWICMVTATFFAFLAMLLAYLGMYSIMKFKPFIPHEEPPMYPMGMEAPVAYDVAPVPSPYLEPVVSYPAMAPQYGY